MKMILVNDDNTTTKVNIITLNGNIVSISKELKEGFVNIAIIMNPEIMFYGDSFVITGYCKKDKDFIYEIKSFELKKR